jgi:ectoine hydroxylase-related dioxygenase (phytanoyl-CoA dioxygenase family)
VELIEIDCSAGKLSDEDFDMALMSLRVTGVVILRNVHDPDRLRVVKERFLAQLEEFAEIEDPNRGASRYGMPLPFSSPFTDADVVANQVVVTILEQLLGSDLICSYFASDTPLPGSQYQQVHADRGILFPEVQAGLPPFAFVVNTPLVDFREDNGPLEVWPYGTHMIGDPDLIPVPDFTRIEEAREKPIERLADRLGAKKALAPLGSILIRDLRVWHRGTPNRSAEPRPMLAFVFNLPWYKHGDIRMTPAAYDALPPRAQSLFRTALRQ